MGVPHVPIWFIVDTLKTPDIRSFSWHLRLDEKNNLDLGVLINWPKQLQNLSRISLRIKMRTTKMSCFRAPPSDMKKRQRLSHKSSISISLVINY